VFQEIDQVAIMRGCVKWADRVYNLKRIPEQVNNAFQHAMSGKPGPTYLDFPGDLLYSKIEEEQVDWSTSGRPLLNARPLGDPEQVDALILALSKAKKPVIVSGSGVIWSRAWTEMRELVETAGIPFYTTPQGRGVVPDDHPLSYLSMRSTAFKDADLIVVLGTRMNYIISHAAPPRFNAEAKIARIDIDANEIATAPRKIDIGIVGDCKMVLNQILRGMQGKVEPDRFKDWRKRLADGVAEKLTAPGANKPIEDGDIHPLRLCEEINNFIDRDAILVVDGQEVLNFGRQSMQTHTPGHRLNSGPFGTMGVGLPFALGAKLAKPDKQVVCLHGDGSFGLNAMELDTAVRHKLPVLVVISLNGGWTADPKREKPGRDLGYRTTKRWRRHSAVTATTSTRPRTSARRSRAPSVRWIRVAWPSSTCAPTTAPAPGPCSSPSTRPKCDPRTGLSSPTSWRPAASPAGRPRGPPRPAAVHPRRASISTRWPCRCAHQRQ
jgi:thiamine pyrophosphate-dependent acetolactate synthase large subunit-like protein